MRTLKVEEIQSISGGVGFAEILLDMAIVSISANVGATLAYFEPLMNYSTTTGYLPNRLILVGGIILGSGIGVAITNLTKIKAQFNTATSQ